MKGHSEDIIAFVRLPKNSQTSQVLRGVSFTHVFKSIHDAKHFSRGLSTQAAALPANFHFSWGFSLSTTMVFSHSILQH